MNSFLEDRFLSNFTVGNDEECWEWKGGKTNGYGQITIMAHRLSYELMVGRIPEGLQLDHLCRNRACVNPKHLEPVTIKENVARGQGLTAINSLKTHCMRGHPFDKLNTYMQDNKRHCRKCRAQYDKKKFTKEHLPNEE